MLLSNLYNLMFCSARFSIAAICLSVSLASAQDALDKVKKKIPLAEEIAKDQIPAVPTKNDVVDKAGIIAQRIATLQKRQAEYLLKVASGKIKPNADLVEKWPKIQSDVFSLRADISALNSLDPNDRKRPAAEAKILSSLMHVGLYLLPASHPQFTSRTLDKQQLAEMARIETAIENISYGDRKKAKPVEVVGLMPFTLISLPVPITLKSDPGQKIYLVATTGGAFSNGLSLIELETDENGIAKTTWVSIGESVGTCDISIYSQTGIERQEIQIEVVAPSLAMLEGLPKPDKALLLIPKAANKIAPLKK